MSEPVIQRRYTLNEIDDMRLCLMLRIDPLWRKSKPSIAIEEELRTAMMAGVEVSEVRATVRQVLVKAFLEYEHSIDVAGLRELSDLERKIKTLTNRAGGDLFFNHQVLRDRLMEFGGMP